MASSADPLPSSNPCRGEKGGEACVDVHGQVTWADDTGVHDEGVFYLPQAMIRHAAASQWSALPKDGPAGILHKSEEAPRAKFHGAICSHDSNAVNLLIVKHLRIDCSL